MNKRQLIETIREETNMPSQMIQTTVDTFCGIVQDKLENGNTVDLCGFGKFYVKRRRRKTFTLPNGGIFESPEHDVPAFKSSRVLVKQVWDAKPDTPEEVIRKHIIKKINHIYRKRKLVGSIDFSDEEYESLLDDLSKVYCAEKIQEIYLGSLFGRQLLFTTLVEISKRWKNNDGANVNVDDESGFWPYVFKTITGDESHNQRLYNDLIFAISKLINEKAVYRSPATKLYYATLMMHALAPRSSLFAFFDLCFNIYKKDLDFGYTSEDKWICQDIAAELTNVFVKKNNRSDKKISIGSNVYALKVGLKSFATNKKLSKHFVSFIDKTLYGINKLYYGESLTTEKRLDNCLTDWWANKLDFEGMSHRIGGRERKETVSQQNIFVKYVKDNDDVFLSIPAIRLDNERSKVKVLYYVDGAFQKCEKLNTKRGELVVSSVYKECSVNDLVRYSASGVIDIRVKVAINDNVVFDSAEKNQLSLKRDFILFEDDKEILSQFNRPSNYFVYSTDIDSLKKVPNDISRISRNLYNIYPVSGEMLESADRQVVFIDSQKLTGNVLVPCLEGNVNGGDVTWDSPNGKQCSVFKDKVNLFIPARYNIKGLELRCGDQSYRLAEMEYVTLGNETKVFELHKDLIEVEKQVDVQLYSFEKEKTILQESIILLPTLTICFNRDFYYGDEERKVVISNRGLSRTLSWRNVDNEVVLNLNKGNLIVRIPYLQWRISTKEWNNEPIVGLQWYKDLLSDSDWIEIRFPKYERKFDLQVKVEEHVFKVKMNKNAIYEVGRMVYAQERKKSVLVFLDYTDKFGNKKNMQLFNVATTEYFTSCPLLYQEGKIYWNAESTFIGDKESKFFLVAKQSNKDYIRENMELDCRELNGFEEGAYQVVVQLKDKNIFQKSFSNIVFEDEFLVGKPEKFRFRNKRLYIRRAICRRAISLNETLVPFDIRYYIQDLNYVNENGITYYEGTLCWKDEDGHFNAVDSMVNEKGADDDINPVRLEFRDEHSFWMVVGWNGGYDFLGTLFYDKKRKILCNVDSKKERYCEVVIYKFKEENV